MLLHACSPDETDTASSPSTSAAGIGGGVPAAPMGGQAPAPAAGIGAPGPMTIGTAGTPATPSMSGTGAGSGATPMMPASTGGSSGDMPDAGGSDSGAAPDAGTTGSSGCGNDDIPENGRKTIDVGGTTREYIVTAPDSYDSSKPHRLIFAWHGLGGTAMQMASSYYGLASRSAGSAVFIAAQGLPGTGQQSGLAAWSNVGDGDIAFTRAMLDWAKTSYCIDVERVFSIGMSNGGMMSNVVGCELGDSFRAIVAMSGGGPKPYAMKACTGEVAVWISHGNRDNNVPFSYGEASRDYWVGVNHCDTATMPATPEPCVEYQGCDPDLPVQFCEFDGGHMVPSFAAEAAWTFFERF